LQKTRNEFVTFILIKSTGKLINLYDYNKINAISNYLPSFLLFFEVLGCIYNTDSSKNPLIPSIELLNPLTSTQPFELILSHPSWRFTFCDSYKYKYSSSAYRLFNPIWTKLSLSRIVWETLLIHFRELTWLIDYLVDFKSDKH